MQVKDTVLLLLFLIILLFSFLRQHLELVIQEPESKDLLENSLQEALSGVLTKPQLINIVSEPSKRACARCPQVSGSKTHAFVCVNQYIVNI